MVTITLYVRQQKRHRCIEQSLGLVGEGKGGMIWKNGIETCIISYKKRIKVRCRVQDAWGWCTGMTRRDGVGGGGGGRGIQDWEHVYTHGVFMLMCGKANTIL